MSEEKKTIELKEEDLEKVSGGYTLYPGILENSVKYSREPNGTFNIWDIVEEDFTGIRYQILYFAGYENGANWYFAEVVYVPENEFSANLRDTKYVNSSFVQKVN